MITADDLRDIDRHAADRSYSQTGEDGILKHIFRCLGVDAGYLVDIGAGDGWNLSNVRVFLNSGWRGLLLDVNAHHGVEQAMVTDENVNAVLDAHQVPADFDLLSLDIDGQDWWVWRALNRRPKIIIIEVNGNLPGEPPVTVPRYPPWSHDGSRYYGASFAAMRRLGRAKGYTLIHNRHNLNLFFARNDMLVPGPGHLLDVPFTQSITHIPDPSNREWHHITDQDFVELAGAAPPIP
jgi:hypothetical protein